MRKRISRSVLLTAALALLLTAALLISILFDLFAAQSAAELRREAETLRYSLSHTQDDAAFLAALPTDYRITLIDHDGSVLYDNSADAEAMDNHASRPEIVEAFAVGSGEARRRSSTLAEETWYYAIATQDGQVLRIATNRATMMGMCMQVLPMLLGLLLLVLLGMFLLSERLTAWIVRPVNTLNLDAPLENEAYDE
ncbi:MAG: histidine kinase, partial [Clostridiales bacterium]|nr:histidine kinase [Clostridiales bacterium]